MEETVPLASNIGNNSQVQQRAAAAAAAAANTNTNTNAVNIAHTDTNTNANTNDDDDDNRSSRRRTAPSAVAASMNINITSSSASSSTLLSSSSLLSILTNLFSKAIVILSILFKIALYPLRKLSYTIFPNGEFDGLTVDGVADSAARSFVAAFLREYIIPIYGAGASASAGTSSIGSSSNSNISGGNGAGGNQIHEHERNDGDIHINNNTSHSDDNDNNNDNDKALLTTCPFKPTGYSNTIESITTKCTNHQESITNFSLSLDQSSIPKPPPLMLIYLHSPFHQHTTSFCQSKLCSSRILKFLNRSVGDEELVCWGGSVHTADGKNVMSMMNVTAFPFLALVRVRPQSASSSSSSSAGASSSATSSASANNNANVTRANLEIYLRMEGHKLNTITPSTLYTYISRSISEYQQTQNEEISRTIARQEEINLRNQQDREYELALEEARRKEREKEEEEQRKREEEQKRIEEEERVRALEESRISEAERILYLHGDEPDGSDKSEKCVRIRFMLPSGQRVERRFRGRETIDTVKSFLILYFEKDDGKKSDEYKIKNFQLSSNYPKKALVDGSATLESEGLCPQAVIMVQDLDA